MNRIGVFGANGRMGLALLEAVTKKEDATLTGAYVRDNSPLLDIAVNQLNSAATADVSFSKDNADRQNI